jgi:hypothetical protein
MHVESLRSSGDLKVTSVMRTLVRFSPTRICALAEVRDDCALNLKSRFLIRANTSLRPCVPSLPTVDME